MPKTTGFYETPHAQRDGSLRAGPVRPAHCNAGRIDLP